jgi:glucose/arabinose dehydrogenase
MQAHSAPLGLEFYSGDRFPPEYRGDLFVAFHGSWNRSEPVGYKIVRIPLAGDSISPVEDFAVGWLDAGSSWGRPVDIITAPDGSLFISDDDGGRIYRIYFEGS